MGARGTNIAQEAHTVLVVPPGSISGGATGQIFSMKNAAKCNIALAWGALAAAQGTVQLFACTDINGTGAAAIAFDLFQQVVSGQGNDVLASRQAIPPAGYVPRDLPNALDLLHLQADQMPQGFPYLKLVLGNGATADYACAIAVLTGVRFQGDANQSATV